MGFRFQYVCGLVHGWNLIHHVTHYYYYTQNRYAHTHEQHVCSDR